MKFLFILSFIFINLSSTAQLTTRQLTTVATNLSLSVKRDSVEIAALKYKLELKDERDDERNQKIDLLLGETTQLKKNNDSLKLQNAEFKKIFDNAVVSLDSTQFKVNPVTRVATFVSKPDTFIIIKKAPRLIEVPISKSVGTVSESRKPYTLTFPLEEDQKEIDGLKTKVKSFERKMGTMQKTIDKQKVTIDKLKVKKK